MIYSPSKYYFESIESVAISMPTLKNVFLEQNDTYTNHLPINETTLLLNSEKPHLTKYKKILSKLPKTKMKSSKTNNTYSHQTPANIDDKHFNWWTKFYNSMNHSGITTNYAAEPITKHKLQIFDTELEKQPQYDYLQDWAETIQINRKSDKHHASAYDDKRSGSEIYSSLKCFLKIEKCLTIDGGDGGTKMVDESFTHKYSEFIKMNTETNVTIRVYLVQGLNLRSHDMLDSSDTYVRIEYGNQKVFRLFLRFVFLVI